MKRIPIATSVKSTIKSIIGTSLHFDDIKIIPLESYQEVLSYFQYQMPEIKIIDFGDPNIDGMKCLKIIQDDPWLLFGGIIAITNTHDERVKLEQLKEPNFLFVSAREDFESNSKQILKILQENGSFLQNRGLVKIIDTHKQGCFISDSNHFAVTFYSNLISTYLYNTDRISNADRISSQCVMMELLTNALEHGNCGISYEEKIKWTESGKDISDLIKEKIQNPAIRNKKIYINYDISPERTKISIKDEGKGFDWKSRIAPEIPKRGMGIKMALGMAKNMAYNEIGNEVSFEIKNQKNIANFTPAILKSQEVMWCKHMQVICKENEESNNLFYISSGRYAVYVDNKLMTVLTPADIFIGEMAFLLNDRRSATIVSIGNGVLIKIPKMNFMKLIDRYPYYGIFLSRLLASRLLRQSKAAAALKETRKK